MQKKSGKFDLTETSSGANLSFSSPEEVLNREDLTEEVKIEILRRWAYDACEESVATEEGMSEVDGSLLQQIMCALGSITEEIDLAHTPPTKQGGLDRSAVKPKR